jgi:hypothetical protein
MKYIGKMKMFWVLAVALGASAMMTEAQAQQAKAGKAEVRSLRGSAKYSQGGGVWVPLKVGTVLRSGAVVQTGPESIVDFFLGDNGPVVRMTAETQLGFDKLAIMAGGVEPVVETQLNISNGRILGNVKKLAAASKYNIKTPTGTAGVRGTDFEVTVTVRGTEYVVTYTSVNGTLVATATVNGQQVTRTINTGESWTPGSTDNPTPLTDAQRGELGRLIGDILDNTLRTGDIVGTTQPGAETDVRISPTTGSGG